MTAKRSARGRRLLRGGVFTLGSAALLTLVSRVAGLGAQGYFVSVFGASRELDAFYLALIFPTMLVAPLAGTIELTVGTEYATVRGTDAAAAYRRAELRRWSRWAILLTIITLGLAPALSYASAPGASDDTHALILDLAWLVYPSIGWTLMSGLLSAFLIGSGRIQAPICARTANTVLTVAVVIVGGSSIESLAIGFTAASIAECALLYWWTRRTEGEFTRAATPSPKPPLTGFGSLYASQIAVIAVPVIDQAFVGGLSSGDVVRFAIAVRFYDAMKAMILLPNARLAQSRLARVRDDINELRAQYRVERTRGILTGVVACVATAVLMPILVELVFVNGSFTQADADESIRLGLILSGSLLVIGLGYVQARVVVVLGRAKLLLITQLLFLALNVGLDAVLIGRYGTTGVALATGATYLALSILYEVLLGRSWSRRKELAA